MDDVSESTRQSLESIEPVQTIPRRSVSRSRRKRGSNFVEKQEIAAQRRQKDRDDARDAADAAMAYLQSIRDPLGDLKGSYRAKYGDASDALHGPRRVKGSQGALHPTVQGHVAGHQGVFFLQ